MKKRKMYIIALCIATLGIICLLGAVGISYCNYKKDIQLATEILMKNDSSHQYKFVKREGKELYKFKSEKDIQYTVNIETKDVTIQVKNSVKMF